MSDQDQPPGGGDYLWDRSGPVDPEVVRLESVLGGLRYRGRPEAPQRLPRRRFRWSPIWAGAVALAAAALLVVVLRGNRPVPSIDHPLRLAGSQGIETLPKQTWLEADRASGARIVVASLGEVQVAPRSLLQVVRIGPDEQRLRLEHGRLDARIDAPPRLFVVDTPVATAVDLGCVYTLSIEPGGLGYLSVTSGWVELVGKGLTSLVPAGARSITRVRSGPGTPYFEDAPPALIEAVGRFDSGDKTPGVLEAIVGSARAPDSLTLWHLIPRTSGLTRRKIVQRLEALLPRPDGIDEATILALDPKALEAWRQSCSKAWSRSR